MKILLRYIPGPWDAGWVLNKHSISSVFLGYDEYGHPRFNTTHTEVGEALYQLKYKNDWTQCKPLAQAIAKHIYPKFANVGFIVPMPASESRPSQPVTEIAKELGVLVNVPVFDNVLSKKTSGTSLKNLQTKDEKMKAIADSFSVHDEISEDGQWNVLLVDDLFATGATMEAATKALRSYSKVGKIYVAALTWR